MSAPNPFAGRWATVTEVARACRVDTATVRRWCESGKLGAKKVFGRWLIDLERVKRGKTAAIRNVWSAVIDGR